LDFEKWLSKNGLLKGIVMFGEDLTFARRAYLVIIKELQYIPSSDVTKASTIITIGKGDGIALNKVFVSILRANKIPARLAFRKNPLVKKDEPSSYACTTFYVDQIGWITADPTPWVRGRNPSWAETKQEEILKSFGLEDTKSIVSGIEGLNFVELPIYGPKHLDMTGPTILFDHKIISSDFLS